MWVKAVLVDEGIELWWQVRTKVVANALHVYDANGVVERKVPMHRGAYPDPMRKAGLIPIDDAFLAFCGEELFEDAVAAVMRHAATMVAEGYGETPEQICEYFHNMNELNFLDGVSYRVDRDHGIFRDMTGVTGTVLKDGDGKAILTVSVGDSEYDCPIDGPEDVVSLLIATVPI